MSDNVRINQLAEAVMKGLTEYADLATDDMKKAVSQPEELFEKRLKPMLRQIQGNTAKAGGRKQQKKRPIHWRLRCVPRQNNSLPIC